MQPTPSTPTGGPNPNPNQPNPGQANPNRPNLKQPTTGQPSGTGRPAGDAADIACAPAPGGAALGGPPTADLPTPGLPTAVLPIAGKAGGGVGFAAAGGAGTAAGAAPTAGRGGRRSGELYRQVAGYLASRPGVVLKVGEVTAAIDAPSSGAVFEALKKMADAGYAIHHTGPHRFEITPAGIAAAGNLPPAPPRTPRAPSAGSSAGAPRSRQPLLRPNGERYWPRRLAGGTDVDVLRRLRDKRIPVLLYGPPGTGKTALVEAAFPQLLTITGTGDSIVDDFLGGYHQLPDGSYEFAYGPLVTAMREGRTLLVDDATLIPPKVLAVLYPAMDGRGVITIPSYRNERVEAADGFYVIGGHNPGVHGAILTEALASRFDVHIEVTTDWDLARRLGVPAAAVNAAITLNQEFAAGKVSWAPQLRELLGFTRVAKSIGLPAAIGNLAGRAPDDDRAAVTDVLTAAFGSAVTVLALGTQR